MYPVVLSIHIIAIISWMAGILYLFRLFVYHAQETEAVVKDRFKIMEEKLYKIITMPAMGVALLMGIWMIAINPSLMSHGWMHAKLLLVVFLIGITHFAAKIRRELATGSCSYSSKTFRILNEVPTVLMILIVFLVILKPF